MDDLRLSVVVVSTDRPRALARCLMALHQMRSTRFEVIVVADEPGLTVARALPFSDRLILLPQDQPNISVARNTGIEHAAGDVVAFIDDDAVPEPDWAEALLAPFCASDLTAVTGPVVGRNGISLQWGRMAVDRIGRDRWLSDGEDPGTDDVLKLHGTNLAIRRTAFAELGGFDTGYHFYMDETDLARRFLFSGKKTRYHAAARVHHGFAASKRRTEDRIPLSLYDIGASTALFLRRHAEPDEVRAQLAQLEEDQRTRLFRLVRKRKLDSDAVRRLMESLLDGISDGQTRDGGTPSISNCSRDFLPLRTTGMPEMRVIWGRRYWSRRHRQRAKASVAAGVPVFLLLIEPTPRKHKLRYVDGGWWEQTGGLFGPSTRSDPRFKLWRYKARFRFEIDRSDGIITQQLLE